MKKFFSLLIVLAMCSGNVMALDNEPEEGISFMGLFGMNVSKLQNHEYNAKVGATMGIRADYMLPNAHGTYLTAGVDWTMKGGKLSYSEMVGTTNVDATAKYALHYFEVPIRVGFRYNASDELGLYGEVGPYFAVGVGGKHKVKLDMDGDAADQIEDAGTYKAFRNYGYPDKTFSAGTPASASASEQSTTSTTTSCSAATGAWPTSTATASETTSTTTPAQACPRYTTSTSASRLAIVSN